MPRTHKRNAAQKKRGMYLAAHQGQLAFAHDNRAFYRPDGPGGSLIAHMLVERDPTSGRALPGIYFGQSADLAEEVGFTCPECGHVYVINQVELAVCHRYIMRVGKLTLMCRHCPRRAPILTMYRNSDNGTAYIKEGGL